MSDMASDRITVRIPKVLTERLRARSAASGANESQMVRKALEQYLNQPSGHSSAYELAAAAGIIGVTKDLPKDLSTNPRHFSGFGRNK
jgi:metal-responsive CopG/Arc/MetJ family transcriptional regulator